MANTARNKPRTTQPNAEENKAIENMQSYYETNKKRINTIITVLLVLIVGIFAYFQLYKAPREEKAATKIAQAQQYFERDSMQQALNGDGQYPGFLKIIKDYGGTKTGNLAHYYAGVAYLHMGDYQNAIKHLKDFNGKGTMVEYAAYGALGDAYMEAGNAKEGVEYYKKAIGGGEDSRMVAPIYAFRAGIAYEMLNQPKEAIKMYELVRDEYPQATEAREVTKYLARLGELE